MKKSSLITIIIGLILVLVGAFAAVSFNKRSSKVNESKGSESGANNESVDYTLELSSYKFTPNILEVEPGKTVKIKIKNIEGNHNFVSPDLNIDTEIISPGEEVIVPIQIPANSSGKVYEFHCSEHSDRNMTGTIKVK